ncbi:MAG: hypothetical protein H0W63_05920 [Gemmatimonadaceae bacterium]|nr:hypothetical protein [Gemmatimonadaceae bacterium]
MADEITDKIGPIGTIVGGIARAVGGWWAGRSVADASESYAEEEDSYYRDRYAGSPHQLADRRYEVVRPAYQLGHLAHLNPDYAGRDFDSIEQELRAGWSDQVRSRHGDWGQAREYAREAYTQNFSVASREAVLQGRASAESLSDKVDNTARARSAKVAGAFDGDRDDKGDDGNAEARLSLPVSRR